MFRNRRQRSIDPRLTNLPATSSYSFLSLKPRSLKTTLTFHAS
jgi:hypothetical protein